MHAHLVCESVCVCERERERESACVCVSICACTCVVKRAFIAPSLLQSMQHFLNGPSYVIKAFFQLAVKYSYVSEQLQKQAHIAAASSIASHAKSVARVIYDSCVEPRSNGAMGSTLASSAAGPGLIPAIVKSKIKYNITRVFSPSRHKVVG